MRGRLVQWDGGYTQADAATLTAYHQGLQSQFGWTPVGAPVYRARSGGDGAVAAALYDDALMVVRVKGQVIHILAVVWADLNYAALRTFTQQTFGLTSGPGPLHERQDVQELYE